MNAKDIKFWQEKGGVDNPHECENCGTIYNIDDYEFGDDETRAHGGTLHSCPKCQRITRED